MVPGLSRLQGSRSILLMPDISLMPAASPRQVTGTDTYLKGLPNYASTLLMCLQHAPHTMTRSCTQSTAPRTPGLLQQQAA
jgi:hypothetical protein